MRGVYRAGKHFTIGSPYLDIKNPNLAHLIAGNLIDRLI